jgi:hypothetical protein
MRRDTNPYDPPSIVPEPRSSEGKAILSIASLALSLCAAGLLIFVVSHLRADRSRRRPVIGWEGPAAPYAMQLAYSAWLLNGVSAALAYASMGGKTREQIVSALSLIIVLISFAASFVVWLAVTED